MKNNALEFIFKLLMIAAIFSLGLYIDALEDRLSSIEKTLEVK